MLHSESVSMTSTSFYFETAEISTARKYTGGVLLQMQMLTDIQMFFVFSSLPSFPH